MFFLEQGKHGVPVANVRLHKAEVGIVHHGLQGGQVAGVGQLIQADDAIVRVLVQHMEHEVAADETGAAGHDNGLAHGYLSP